MKTAKVTMDDVYLNDERMSGPHSCKLKFSFEVTSDQKFVFTIERNEPFQRLTTVANLEDVIVHAHPEDGQENCIRTRSDSVSDWYISQHDLNVDNVQASYLIRPFSYGFARAFARATYLLVNDCPYLLAQVPGDRTKAQEQSYRAELLAAARVAMMKDSWHILKWTGKGNPDALSTEDLMRYEQVLLAGV